MGILVTNNTILCTLQLADNHLVIAQDKQEARVRVESWMCSSHSLTTLKRFFFLKRRVRALLLLLTQCVYCFPFMFPVSPFDLICQKRNVEISAYVFISNKPHSVNHLSQYFVLNNLNFLTFGVSSTAQFRNMIVHDFILQGYMTIPIQFVKFKVEFFPLILRSFHQSFTSRSKTRWLRGRWSSLILLSVFCTFFLFVKFTFAHFVSFQSQMEFVSRRLLHLRRLQFLESRFHP